MMRQGHLTDGFSASIPIVGDLVSIVNDLKSAPECLSSV